MALRGWATFAWQSDYGQFYLIDREDVDFLAPEVVTSEMMSASFHVPPTGLVVYTGDCLQQQIRIHIHDAEPELATEDVMSGKRWTRVQAARTRFPSRSFAISSPSLPHPMPGGPAFFLESEMVGVRISWMEFEGIRDDSVPVEPDVIEIALWPA